MSSASRIEGIAGGSRGVGGITGGGGKNVNPIYNESVPPKPPAGKPIDLKNPPKVPMTNPPKVEHKPEVKAPAPKDANTGKGKPMVLPGRGKFTGDIARYNWTGK